MSGRDQKTHAAIGTEALLQEQALDIRSADLGGEDRRRHARGPPVSRGKSQRNASDAQRDRQGQQVPAAEP